MNDFIKKLAIECAGQLEWDFPKDPESYTFTPDEVNRFAELIAMHTKADAISAQTPASCINRSDIIRMAREAGLDFYVNDVTEKPYAIKLGHFAALVAAHEREECAKVCDDEADDGTEGEWDSCCRNSARQIRARSEE